MYTSVAAVGAAALPVFVQEARPCSLFAPAVMGTWKSWKLVPEYVIELDDVVCCPPAVASAVQLQTASVVPAREQDSTRVTVVPAWVAAVESP